MIPYSAFYALCNIYTKTFVSRQLFYIFIHHSAVLHFVYTFLNGPPGDYITKHIEFKVLAKVSRLKIL